MDNMQITQVDGEPPIYREMKPLPVTLESCILNSEEDFPYNQTEQTVLSQGNCNDGELSAEEINSMIMINEGPDSLSSIQEEFESEKVNASIRNSSDIKKILTSDLPKSGRFLSTKSLQQLSGAKKVIKKNSKYVNEDETDVDDPSDSKVKKVLTKQSKAIKENLNKTNQDRLDCKNAKKSMKLEKSTVKSLKKETSVEKINSKKKSLKTLKTVVETIKSENLISSKKIFKKKMLENNAVVKKKEATSKTEEPDSAKKARESSEVKKKKSKPKNKPKLLISRSGRVRKIKDVSDFVLSKNKQEKILSPVVDQGMPSFRIDTEDVADISQESVPNEGSFKLESGQENKSQRDLLQSALSESVESWFDISSGIEKKGKRARGKVKIIPKDSDNCFEETEIVECENSCIKDSSKNSEKIISPPIKVDDVKNEEEKGGNIKKEKNGESDTQLMTEPPIEVTKNEKQKSDIQEPKSRAEENSEELVKKVAAPNGKKVKPAARQIMGYKKKRRKGRNISVTSYLKNYGEKINFDVKLDSEAIETKKQKSVTEETKNVKKQIGKSEGGNNVEERKGFESKFTDLSESPEKTFSVCHKTSPLKRSQSAESLQTSVESNVKSPRKSTEMPACLPSRAKEKELALVVQGSCIDIKKEIVDDFEHENKEPDKAKVDKRKTVMRKKPIIEVVKKEIVNDSEDLKKEIVNDSEDLKKEIVNDSEDLKKENIEEVNEEKFEEKDVEKGNKIKIEKENLKEKRRNPLFTKGFGMQNKRKKMCGVGRRGRFSCRKSHWNHKKQGDEFNNADDNHPVSIDVNSKKTDKVENDEGHEGPNEKKEVAESLSTSSTLSIPLKKRPRRIKTNDAVDEVVKEIKEGTNGSEKRDCERRKSHREIKPTPKIIDMISISFSQKRYRNTSHSKEDLTVVKGETESSVHKSTSGSDAKTRTKEALTEQPLAVAPSVENYLQSKMDANASNFESSWEPGDLVWARFAGNPFWPALILRDPFNNDEYSRVKYLGRLPRPFVHVQFLADYGRRAWGPELYIMNFNSLEEFEKLKSNLPEVNAFTQRKDLVYQQAFFTPKKMEKNWGDAVREAETLKNKSKDERITYMKIKYPLVKYAASVANGRLVPNERTKGGDSKSPLTKTRKRRNVNSACIPDGNSGDWPLKESEDTLSKDTFECINASDKDEGNEKNEKESPKITLKLVRSPKKGSKRKSSKLIEEVDEKKIKKRIKKEMLDDDYVPSDSGSNGEKGSETSANKQKKFFLFKGARTEKVCQICVEILENEKIIKCKGPCLGLFHKSCAEKMSANLPPLEGALKKGVRNKRRKKLFADNDADNSTEFRSKESDEKEWRCNDCLRGENPCFVCGSRSGNRQRCCVASCGKFYHQKCLKLYPQTIYNQGAPIRKSQFLQQSKTTETESPHYQILSCPLHVCHTCASDNPADFNKKYLCEKLVKCIKCPSAYHGGNYCVPAGSTILNTSQIICAKHGDPGKKSHVNISWCFICNMGGSLICCEWCPSSFHLDCLNLKPPDGPYICEECESGRFPLYGEVVWVKLGRYRWWPARVLFPQEILPNIMALPHKPWEFAVRFYGSNDHYWLNRGRVFLYQEGDSEQKFKGQSHVDKIYQRAVQEATKDYFAIQEERKSRLLETTSSGVMKPPPYVKIKTNKAVGKVQLGNLSQSEPQTCDCDPNSEAPCCPGSDCLNRMLLVECNPNYCNAGSRCGNQSFEKREYPPLEPYRTETRGWGLRSSIDIPKGAFVIEYVGEVVDDEEFKRRMKRKQETKDINYYFLTIDKDRMIDAGPKGNLARFMNHSCSPNCETQKWTVNGDTRVGLFALRDIPAGTELTFNYNLDCIGNEKKPCHCEEENCSGFIGVKAKNEKSEAFKNKILKRLDKESEDECFVCNDGGELMVCDVPNCPKVFHLECVNLTEWPNEIWFCPRHRCCLCNKTTKRCCKLCPTAYCFNHLDNNIFSDYQGGLLCSKHSSGAVKPAQILRKASYVNRNTPVIEYEKPFAEKYRPPPQKERASPEEKKEEILMEPNLTDNTPIVVENPLLSSATPSSMSDGVSVQVLYVDEEGQIVSVDESATPNPDDTVTSVCESEELPKPIKRKKRTNIPRKKLNPPVVAEENKQKSPTKGGINFESLMIKSVEDKILDSKLNMDNIYNIIGGGGSEREREPGQSETDSAGRCVRDDGSELKSETVNKKEDTEVDRSRRSKYFKIITPEKFIKVSESETNQKKVTDFNYIEFMHPLRSGRSKTKTDENTRK